jgi:16S rRNA (cytidine1402-2'-O)-methyltransferase
MKTLYLVSTPVGNIEDITARAKRILSEVDIIACEDTRKTGLFLQRLEIPYKETISYFEENESRRIPEIIEILNSGKDVALVSNAGTPTISDPGFKLVRECQNNGVKIIAVPGASALLTALVSSGLPTDKFLFLGFLPIKDNKRQKIWEMVKKSQELEVKPTVIFYESPYRLLKTLEDIRNNFGDIEIIVARELTKIYEEIRRESVDQSLNYFQRNIPKGEFTLLFHL